MADASQASDSLEQHRSLLPDMTPLLIGFDLFEWIYAPRPLQRQFPLRVAAFIGYVLFGFATVTTWNRVPYGKRYGLKSWHRTVRQ
jgi:hypothetical protein